MQRDVTREVFRKIKVTAATDVARDILPQLQ
jgi:hypothetical protein